MIGAPNVTLDLGGHTVSGDGSGGQGIRDFGSDDGIQVDHATTHVGQNTANRNGDLGIEAIAGTIDAGGNRAKQNRNHAQCVNVSCSKSGKP